MRIDFKQLKQLSVETLSGEKLGHVNDIILDIDGQLVAQYHVKSSILSTKEYLVSRDQVVRFEEKRMIVDDTVTPVKAVKDEKKTIPRGAEPVSMRSVGKF